MLSHPNTRPRNSPYALASIHARALALTRARCRAGPKYDRIRSTNSCRSGTCDNPLRPPQQYLTSIGCNFRWQSASIRPAQSQSYGSVIGERYLNCIQKVCDECTAVGAGTADPSLLEIKLVPVWAFAYPRFGAQLFWSNSVRSRRVIIGTLCGARWPSPDAEKQPMNKRANRFGTTVVPNRVHTPNAPA